METNQLNQSNELKILINLETGHETFTTEQIKGKLNSIIVDSEDKVEIIIESQLGYMILHRHEHMGIEYYCPRARTTASEWKLTDYPDFEEYLLNEPLNIIVIGPKNKQVKIIIRMD